MYMPKKERKLKIGFFSFTCCQGCQFTVLFIDKILELFKKLDVAYFHLLKDKNREEDNFDIAFVEGAITTKSQVKKLRIIRKKAKFVVALGACAINGGIPAMRNYLENKELQRYVYNQKMLKDSIDVESIDKIIKVDYYMRGCPIIKKEFTDFVNNFIKGKVLKEFQGSVCDQCPKRGPNCFLLKKTVCLGALTHGGCDAICTRDEIPCIMCRGPLPSANFPAEAQLFKSWGLSECDICNKMHKFSDVSVVGKRCVFSSKNKKCTNKLNSFYK
jgi:sulfhydrogenase subunit delta